MHFYNHGPDQRFLALPDLDLDASSHPGAGQVKCLELSLDDVRSRSKILVEVYFTNLKQLWNQLNLVHI